MLGPWTSLILFVSSGGSAAIASDRNFSRDPAPASAAALRNSLRLQSSRFWILDFGFSIIGSKLNPTGVVSLLIDFFLPDLYFFPQSER
jgi:hypothetical protein